MKIKLTVVENIAGQGVLGYLRTSNTGKSNFQNSDKSCNVSSDCQNLPSSVRNAIYLNHTTSVYLHIPIISDSRNSFKTIFFNDTTSKSGLLKIESPHAKRD